MSEALPRPDFDRRHHRLSHEELRRHLIDADADRYRLRSELSAHDARTPPDAPARPRTRRMAFGIGTVVMTALAGGLVWQMCQSSMKADDRAVRVQTTAVTPVVVSNQIPSDAMIGADASRSVAKMRRVASRATLHRISNRRAGNIEKNAARRPQSGPPPRRAIVNGPPRPLSPSEFGRVRTVAY